MKTKHRPPQKKTKLLTEEVTNQKGKGKRKQTKTVGKKTKKNVHEQVQEVEDEDEEVQDEENLNGGRNQSNLQRKLNMAADVIEGNSAPQRQ